MVTIVQNICQGPAKMDTKAHTKSHDPEALQKSNCPTLRTKIIVAIAAFKKEETNMKKLRIIKIQKEEVNSKGTTRFSGGIRIILFELLTR